MITVLASIPAPSFNKVGFVYLYGITMALAVISATYIGHHRYSKNHKNSSVILDAFIPVLVSGIIGARIYHLFTGYDWDKDGLSGILRLRNGGLSIWGAVIGGALALFIYSRIKQLDFYELADAIVVGLCVGQFIGRFGNYFNQELFGKPFDGFWALKVDFQYRPTGYELNETFHPVFLYEGLICLSIALTIIFLEKKKNWPRAASFATYISIYCLSRVFMEWLRIDDAQKVFGIRFNLALSLVLAICGFVWLFYLLNRQQNVQGTSNPQ